MRASPDERAPTVTLGVTCVVAATDPPNTASVRVLERLGMRFERQGRLQGLETLFFKLDPADLTPPVVTRTS